MFEEVAVSSVEVFGAWSVDALIFWDVVGVDDASAGCTCVD